MRITLILMLTLLLPVIGLAQQDGRAPADPADTDLRRVVHLAALLPDTEEFDDVWSTYVRNNRDDIDVAATIDRVIKESGELLRQIRAPGSGSTQRPMSTRKLREKMQALADAAIEDDRR